jgi:predicted nucleic acid-binding protein
VLICDTGPIVAALIAGDQDHEPCAQLLRRFAGELAVPSPVVTEAAIFLLGSYGSEPHLRWLNSVATGELEVLDLEPGDYGRVAQLCRSYQDLPLDQVDASVIALAERYGQQRVASIDHRHFSIVRLVDGGSLELLPGA